jgi:hypothetical protein
LIDEARWEIKDTTPNAAWSMKHLGQDWPTGGLVFTTELGGPVDPRNVLRTIEIAAEKAGLKDVGVLPDVLICMRPAATSNRSSARG